MKLPGLAAMRAKWAGKSYWIARYRDGRQVSEHEVDWSLVPRKGLIELRLHCPNGKVGVVGNSVDASDRLFQFKIARLGIALLGGKGGRHTESQVIGMLTGTNGECQIWAWEYGPKRLVGPLADNWHMVQYGMVRNISADHVGAKAD